MAKKVSKYDQAKREQRLVEYRAQGWTLEQIATVEGYSTPQAVSKALNAAYAKIPAPTVKELRNQSDTTNDMLRRKLIDIVDNPPVQHSAIGKVVIDPRTGEPVLDESVRIRAIDQLRKLDDSRRRLWGVDRQPMIPETEALRQMQEWLGSRFPETVTVEAVVVPELDQGETDP